MLVAAISLELALVGIGALAGVALAAAWLIPRRQAAGWRKAGLDDAKVAELENSARGTLVQLIGGIALILTFAATWAQINDARRASEETLEVTRSQQRNERFSRALDQLGSPRLENRVAAIAGLGAMAREPGSPERGPVLQILHAYLQTRARPRPGSTVIPLGIPAPDCSRPLQRGTVAEPDTQAAMDVLLTHADLGQRGYTLVGLDFSGIDSPSASFGGANLALATLDRASLNGASFQDTRLDATRFTRACLRGASFAESSAASARFVGADLSGANFAGATLSSADLPNARLVNAVFDDADLTGANLADAELKGASFVQADVSSADLSGSDVTESQLRDARTDACTRLPWRRRVSARCRATGSIG